jgi:hypothetical protein
MNPAPFDPPLRIRGFGVVIHTLDEAEHFVHEHGPGHAHNWEGLLRRLQLASTPSDCAIAANAFKAWLEAENLLAAEQAR